MVPPVVSTSVGPDTPEELDLIKEGVPGRLRDSGGGGRVRIVKDKLAPAPCDALFGVDEALFGAGVTIVILDDDVAADGKEIGSFEVDVTVSLLLKTLKEAKESGNPLFVTNSVCRPSGRDPESKIGICRLMATWRALQVTPPPSLTSTSSPNVAFNPSGSMLPKT